MELDLACRRVAGTIRTLAATRHAVTFSQFLSKLVRGMRSSFHTTIDQGFAIFHVERFIERKLTDQEALHCWVLPKQGPATGLAFVPSLAAGTRGVDTHRRTARRRNHGQRSRTLSYVLRVSLFHCHVRFGLAWPLRLRCLLTCKGR